MSDDDIKRDCEANFEFWIDNMFNFDSSGGIIGPNGDYIRDFRHYNDEIDLHI